MSRYTRWRANAVRAERERAVRMQTGDIASFADADIAAAIYYLQSLRDQKHTPRIRALVAEQERRRGTKHREILTIPEEGKQGRIQLNGEAS